MIKLLSLATAGLLLALAAPWASALEMGDLVTRSSLGQPYAGEIRIKGELYSQISPDCVRLVKPLQPDNLPGLPPGISIEYVSGQQGGVLRLIGREQVLDPALQVSVFIGCGINLQRDYVVMLDLPSHAERVSKPAQASRPQTPPAVARPVSPSRPATRASTVRPPRQSAPPKLHAAASQEPPTAQPQAETTIPTTPPADIETPPAATTATAPPLPAAQAPQPAEAPIDNDPLITIGLITLIALLLIGIWYQHRRNILAAAREDYSRDGHPITQNPLLTQPQPDDAAAPAPARPKIVPAPLPVQPSKAAEDEEMPVLPATASSEYMMDLTDVMLSFGETQRALSALQDFVHDHPDDAVAPWLRLLELLRLHDKREEFQALASKLHQVFNIAPPEWEVADKATPLAGTAILKQARSLEDFTHIRQRLVDTWGSSEGLNYLDVLVRDNRAGQRRGFPLEIVEETILLRDVLAMRLNKI